MALVWVSETESASQSDAAWALAYWWLVVLAYGLAAVVELVYESVAPLAYEPVVVLVSVYESVAGELSVLL
jgi:hypothetical protein